MASLFDWSATAASNTSCDGLNCNTGMPPSNVDNVFRSIMALVRNSFSSALQSFLAGSAALPVANGGTGGTDLATAQTALGILPEATAAQIRNNTADKGVSTDAAWNSVLPVALTDAATVALDLNTGINFTLTIGGNRTLGAATNLKEGQSGYIQITQDGTGSRTLAYNAMYKFAGGSAPVLSTAASAKDMLFYQVMPGATTILLNIVKGIA